ncbi:MAG: preprotein translocase subunit SecG [Burkholderiaceae bacterium]|nr:preprotein translocase subunit SecG [Burkholderiaceae bacterium]
MSSTLNTIIILIQVLSAIAIVGLVLLQHGKGADMGAAFGSGASGSLFGASGSSNFLSKSTGIAAAIFFTATLALAYLSGGRHASVSGGVLDSLPTAPAASAPAAPAAPVAAPAAATAPAVSTPAAADQAAKTAPATPAQSSQIPK